MKSASLSLLKTQLLRQEGYRRFAYIDTTGHSTVGIGRNLATVGISMDEAEYMLDNDLFVTEAELVKVFPDYEQLDDIRQRVLLNMAFNMGVVALMQFKHFLNYVTAGDFKNATAAMLESLWAKQVPNRANELAQMMESDHDSST